jgi:cysteine dioxygenase
MLTFFVPRRVRLEPRDYQDYVHFDSSTNYTRNLVSTDHETYTLLLLCWNPGRSSPIHDHPCDGCWMRALQGRVRETRYRATSSDSTSSSSSLGGEQEQDHLVCTQDKVYSNGLVFIKDSQGFHKIGNPDATIPAITMHLYSPPFESCKIWLDQERPPCKSRVCFYSAYGKKL